MRKWMPLVLLVLIFWILPWIFLPGEWCVMLFVFSIWTVLVWVKGYPHLSLVGLALALGTSCFLKDDITSAFFLGLAPLALLACLPSKRPRSGWVLSGGGNGVFAFYIAGTRGKSLR